eukprot:16450281-Heterocapsa_arctica.AAC.1
MDDILVIQLQHKVEEINAVREGMRRWALVEWCREPDSLLSDWFLQRGLTATRLGLPEHDLGKTSEGRRVADKIIDQLSEGSNVCLWCSLPCTAWCAWQR